MAIEVAIWLPILILSAGFFIDTIRYIQTVTQMDRVAVSVADLITRNREVVDGTDFATADHSKELGAFLFAANQIALPNDIVGSGKIIISLIQTGSDGRFTTKWQRSGDYKLNEQSRLTVIPDLPRNSTYLVSEVFFRYQPSGFGLGEILSPFDQVIYRKAFFRPRLSALTSLEPRR